MLKSLQKFKDLAEAESYIVHIVNEALDAAVERGSRIAFYGVEISGMDPLRNEELIIEAAAAWLDGHPEASVTLVDKYDSFGRHFNKHNNTNA